MTIFDILVIVAGVVMVVLNLAVLRNWRQRALGVTVVASGFAAARWLL